MRKDRTGERRGRLILIEINHIKNGRVFWKCLCDCGNYHIINGASMIYSCGCLATETKSKTGLNNKIRDTPIQYIKKRIKIDEKTGCWNWTKSLISGYARIGINNREDSPLASRYVFKYIIGIDPTDKQVCHICDNPKCVNPNHLFLGTQIENFKDMKIKGRSARGERNNKAKLKELEIAEIKELKGKKSGAKVAEIYGVCRSTINRIWRNETWSHC